MTTLPDTMQALVLHAVGDLVLERVPLPQPGPGEALLRVAACGVCGSDLPRIFAHGTYRFPLIPGHELSGTLVATVPPGPRHTGERVAVVPLIPCGHCEYCQVGAYSQCSSYDYLGSRRDGGFAEFVCLPQASLLPLPSEVDLLSAALCEPAAVALHALRQGRIQVGERVAILGCGPIGMMLAQWARLMGASDVLLVDIDPRKLEEAARLGLGRTFDASQGDPVSWSRASTAGRGTDLVIEAAGVNATFEQALRVARPLGRVVIMGNPAGDVVLPQGTVSQMLRKQLTVRGTWNSSFAELPVNEWRVVLDMLAARRLDLRSLISHRIPLAQGPSALQMMRSGREYHNRVVLVTDSGSPRGSDTEGTVGPTEAQSHRGIQP